MSRRKIIVFSITAVAAMAIGSCLEYPEAYFKQQIQGSEQFTYNDAILKIKDKRDLKEHGLKTLVANVPAQDEILLQEDLGRAFVAAMDGYIWIVDLKLNKAEPFVKAPLLAGGMVAHPKNTDLIYFCVARATKDDVVAENGPGIYELKISEKTIRKITTRVPKIPAESRQTMQSSIGYFYPAGAQPTLHFSEMTDGNSRRVEKADDLAISADGQRIYFTEPYDHAGAILGVSVQSRNEALTLGKNGNLWKIDLKENSASLVAHGYAYLDGILLEYPAGSTKETSILVNELSKCRLVRLHLSGEKSGKDEVVIDGLPGFPDGMDRDAQGRIWIALVLERSKLITWLHSHPFWKRLALYIPPWLQPVSRKTGLLVLSADGKTPLHYSMHDGSVFSNLIVVVPGRERIYLAVYEKGYRGLNTITYPF